ncbi:MAG: cobalamin-binding protein [Flavobacteriales bacterium]|nr:cobalamin-binding protein [Flavobacteriales bacterium]
MIDFRPERIVCLTEESTETLYLLGEEDRIVGISGFTVRPEQARKEKPKVSLFTDASNDKIVDLKPDLVIGFSDIQADIASQLIKKGINVWVSNQRSLKEIMAYIIQLGSWVGKQEEATELVKNYQSRLDEIKTITQSWENKPKVYFEEWYDPLISGISWVSELIEIAGGVDCFGHLAVESLAKNRIIAEHEEVIKANPDVIFASWCGKMFKKERLLAREGWEKIQAVKDDQIFEIDSSIILQPGPAALTDGVEEIFKYLKSWCDSNVSI